MNTVIGGMSLLACILASSVAVRGQEQPAAAAPVPSPSAKRLRFKFPLPDQPPTAELAVAKGDVRVELSVNRRGGVDKFKLIKGASNTLYVYSRFIKSLSFEPSAAGDAGPWLATLHLSAAPVGSPTGNRFRVKFLLLDVVDGPAQ